MIHIKKNESFFWLLKKIGTSNIPFFYSNEMIITKKSLNENQLKYTYQKQLISDLDFKHKEWSKFLGD